MKTSLLTILMYIDCYYLVLFLESKYMMTSIMIIRHFRLQVVSMLSCWKSTKYKFSKSVNTIYMLINNNITHLLKIFTACMQTQMTIHKLKSSFDNICNKIFSIKNESIKSMDILYFSISKFLIRLFLFLLFLDMFDNSRYYN